ncbi:MAG TPA: HTTM domain-containing protein [Fimbriimonadaceae bacterium]|nr:HTTM domain-containing protein [Fimbriimonadaceae bacterium]
MSRNGKPSKVRDEEQKSLWAALDEWWFGYGSPEALGLFRIAMAFLAFVSLSMVLIDFHAWYTENGFVPLIASRRFNGDFLRFDPLGLVAHPWVTLAFYLLVMAAALLTCVGLWTRISSIVLALGMIALHHRNLMILHSGDTLMRLCLVYLAVAPSGAACSLDRVIRIWRGLETPAPRLISLWGQRLVQFQVAVLYVTTVWHKWRGTYWRDGTATWYPSQLSEFDRFWVPPFVESETMIKVSTYSTLIVELALGTLVFYRPLRKWVLLAGLAMHAFIEWRYNIPLFQYVMVSTYICFFEGHEVRAWARRVGNYLRRLRLSVHLPAGQRVRPAPAGAFEAMDPLDLVQYEAGSGDWHGTSPSGRRVNPFFGSWIRSVGAFPIGLVPGLWPRLLRGALEDAPTQPAKPQKKPAKGAKR